MGKLILASKSPRRQQLLSNMGFDFEIVTREVDESFSPAYTPAEAVCFIAKKKAEAFADLAAQHVILTADTIVVLDEEVIGKPTDSREATQMLQKLSGRTHEVMTACCIYHRDRMEHIVEKTRVHFRNLETAEIAYYVETFQPLDKAGSYGIQEWIGTIGITGIEGSYHNVVGLPTARLYTTLQTYLPFIGL